MQCPGWCDHHVLNTGTFSPETFSDLGEDHHGATEMHQNFRLDLQITRWKRSGAERGWWTTQSCGNLAMRHLTHQVLLIHRVIWFSFCVPISRVMLRRGWRTVEGPEGWFQMLCGPVPRSEQWPKVDRTRQQDPRERSFRNQNDPIVLCLLH